MEKKSERAKKTTAGGLKARSKGRETKISDQIAYLGQLIEHVSDALISTDSQFNILSWNTAAEIIYGWKAEEVIGRRVDEFLQTDYAGRIERESANRQVVEEKYWKGEVVQSRKDGSRFPVLASVSTIKDERGRIIGYVAINRDITEQKRMQETLSSSEKYYRTLIEHSSDGIALVDLNGTVKYVSPAFTRILGYPIEEYVGHNVFAFIHPEDLKYAEALFRKLLEKPYQSVLAQIRELHKDGSWRWIEGHAINLLDEPGVEAVVANYRDITERKHFEEAMRKSEEQYRMLFEGNPHPMWVYDTTTLAFLAVNEAAVSHYGYTRDEFLDMTIREIRPARERERLEENIRTQVASQQRSGPWLHQQKDRTVIEVEIISHDITFLDRPARLVLANDITERKRTEQELRRSEERYRRIANTVPGILYDYLVHEDGTGQFLYVGPHAVEILEVEPADLMKNADLFVNMVHPEDVERLRTEDAMTEQGTKFNTEVRIITPSGVEKWVQLISRHNPASPEDQEIWSGIMLDVTERKQAEEIIGKYAIELESRVEERTAELIRANRAKDEFMANMSHELRTPLNGILAFSETLLEGVRGPLTERQSEAIEIINSSGRHLLGLINDILDVSKIEVGKLDFHPELIDASEICEASLMLVREMAAKKSIDLVFDRLPARWMFHGDPQRMKQILVNLLTNSIKFTPSHGRVTVDVHADTDLNQIKFSITDTGIGISDSDLEKLFDPFFQVDGGLTRQQEGSGLGLALVHKLVNMHGGRVDVKSELGKGSTFVVTLPWSQNMNIEPHTELGGTNLSQGQQQSGAESLAATETNGGQRGTILMAEDKETNVMVVRDYLEYRGYQVVIAYNGVEALAKAEQVLPDAILMDVQMPEMDGLEAIRRLRKNPRFTDIPIIAITALAMPGDRERCLAAGANEYLSKPISLKMLKEMIEKFL